ncbi:glycerol-3-phosphate 1-O-acyltransferase PlsY [bacterium]|nr:glycerol-3-phosphate 1-O-acyltransferase PlsY [bacterium]
MVEFIAAIALSYFLGSLSPSLWLTKVITGKDLRKLGSGNLGATNAWRNCGWKVGLPVGFVDVAKSFVATYIVSSLIPQNIISEEIYAEIICGFVAIFGHIFSIFAEFKGGKGVLTAVGMIVGLMPLATLSCIAVWLIVTVISRMVSLGSILAGFSLPFAVYFLYQDEPSFIFLSIVSGILMVLVTYTHRTNIQRILAGTENKITFKK